MTPRLEDWTIGVREDEDSSWLCILSDSGDAVVFHADRGSGRARVLQDLAIALANASDAQLMENEE